MSSANSPNYANIPTPSYVFGNSQDIHNAILIGLTTDTTDPTNSNYLLANATNQQTFTNFIHNGDHTHNGVLNINNTADDTDNTDIRLAKKRWVKNYYQTLDHTWSGDDTWTGTNNMINLYVSSNFYAQNGSTFHLNTPLTVPDGSGGTQNVGTTQLRYISNVSSDVQNQLNSKQATLTSSTNLNVGNISCANLTASGNITANGKTVTEAQLGDLSNVSSDIQAQINNCAQTTGIAQTLSQGLTFSNDNIQFTSATKCPGIWYAIPTYGTDITTKYYVDAQVATKQATLTAGSVGDSLLASSFVKPNTSPTLYGTNISAIPQANVTGLTTALQYVDATSSIQSQLNSKQSAINSSTNMAIANLTTSSITDNGTCTLSNGLSVTSGSVSFPTNAINQNNINGLTTALQYVDATSSIQTQLNSKQSTLTAGSVTDSLLASSFIKPNTSPILNGSNFYSIPETAITGLNTSLQYVDATSSIQNQLNGKQATLANASYWDATSSIQTQLNSKQATLANASYLDATSSIQTQLNAKQATLANASYLDATSSVQTQLNGKQATLANASYWDATSSIQTQLNAKQATLSNASYLDATSSVQTQLNSKQATLGAHSVTDSMLSTNIPLLNASSNVFSGSIQCAGVVDTASMSCTTFSCTSETDSSLLTADKISEYFQQITTASGTAYTLSYTSGAVFYLANAPSANFSIQLNNVTNASTQSTVFTVIYNTTNKYIPTSITAYSDSGTTQITPISLVYAGGTPTLTTSTIIICQFSLIQMFSTKYCLASIVPYF